MAEKQIPGRKRKWNPEWLNTDKSRDVTEADMKDAYSKNRAKAIINKNKQDLKNIKRMCEVKTTVTTITQAMVSTGLVQSISNLAQNSTSSGRIGSKVKSNSMRISGHLRLLPNVDGGFCRIVVVIDFSQNGTPPTFTDLWQSVANCAQNAPRDLVSGTSSSFKRLIVLYDNFWILNSGAPMLKADDSTVLTLNQFVKAYNWYKRVNHYIYYSGVDSTDADMDQGNMYVLSVASNSSRIECNMRIVWKYTDS